MKSITKNQTFSSFNYLIKENLWMFWTINISTDPKTKSINYASKVPKWQLEGTYFPDFQLDQGSNIIRKKPLPFKVSAFSSLICALSKNGINRKIPTEKILMFKPTFFLDTRVEQTEVISEIDCFIVQLEKVQNFYTGKKQIPARWGSKWWTKIQKCTMPKINFQL